MIDGARYALALRGGWVPDPFVNALYVNPNPPAPNLQSRRNSILPNVIGRKKKIAEADVALAAAHPPAPFPIPHSLLQLQLHKHLLAVTERQELDGLRISCNR